MARLYDLTGAYAELYAQLENCADPEEALGVLDQMERVNDEVTGKAEAYARIMRNAQSDAEALDVEIKRLQAHKKVAQNTVDRLKEHLHYAMEGAGIAEIRTSIGKWRVQKNPWSVVVLDAGKVPAEFTVPQPPDIDKKAILANFKATGEIPEGCDLVQTEGVQFR